MGKRPYSDSHKRAALARYDEARAAGQPVGIAADIAGHDAARLRAWREELAADDIDKPHHVEKRRACLRCGVDFTSTWAGNRLCDRCKCCSDYSGLPDVRTAVAGIMDC